MWCNKSLTAAVSRSNSFLMAFGSEVENRYLKRYFGMTDNWNWVSFVIAANIEIYRGTVRNGRNILLCSFLCFEEIGKILTEVFLYLIIVWMAERKILTLSCDVSLIWHQSNKCPNELFNVSLFYSFVIFWFCYILIQCKVKFLTFFSNLIIIDVPL